MRQLPCKLFLILCHLKLIAAAFKTTFFTTFYFSINNTKQYEKKNFI